MKSDSLSYCIDMQKKGLAKDGKEFQRPVVLQKLAPHKLSLHDRVMFDEKTTSLVQGIKEFTHRVHGKSIHLLTLRP